VVFHINALLLFEKNIFIPTLFAYGMHGTLVDLTLFKDGLGLRVAVGA
jgi:hypothetical protein